ncbi:hypothetical protein D3C80_1176620 [compost metagenome]
MGITAIRLSERGQVAQQSAFCFDKAHISRTHSCSTEGNDHLSGALAVLYSGQLIAAVLQLLLRQPCDRFVQRGLYCRLLCMGGERGYRHCGKIHIIGSASGQREAAILALQFQNGLDQPFFGP